MESDVSLLVAPVLISRFRIGSQKNALAFDVALRIIPAVVGDRHSIEMFLIM